MTSLPEWGTSQAKCASATSLEPNGNQKALEEGASTLKKEKRPRKGGHLKQKHTLRRNLAHAPTINSSGQMRPQRGGELNSTGAARLVRSQIDYKAEARRTGKTLLGFFARFLRTHLKKVWHAIHRPQFALMELKKWGGNWDVKGS